MDEARDGELRELRRRAYGPAPDLDDAELDRLRELEAGQGATAAATAVSDPVDAARRDVAPRVSSGRHAAVAHDADHGSSERDDDARDDDARDDDARDDDARDAPPGARPRIRRRTAVLWAASVVVAVGATVGLSSGLEMGGREVGVVALDPDRAVPSRWDDWYQDAATGVGDFRGLTVIGLVNPEDDSRCVAVVAPRPARTGSPVGGCEAGSFPARAVLTVDDDMPADLLEAFTEGTALEFVLDGSSVRVTAG
ncbi:hypothetical protein CMsap09_01885 [Clavibacter michiganensis]|uniref:Uncharacterized protein n=1 Tax=Clavibacter michiganensis TaxID=28447 RepID=A0A251XQ73_9MICO|nr:hypothetical protein CMsap09_01885 [Clavibacter michiganensis]